MEHKLANFRRLEVELKGVKSNGRILLANSKWCNFNTMSFRRVALLFPLASQGQVGYSHPPIATTDTMM